MKKRIIASTMASVMAISTAATALVASADVKDYKTLAVTKSQLKKFIEEDKEIQALIDGGLEQYGSKSGEKFLKSIEYATAVVEDGKATGDDATVAFLMVKAAYGNLKQHTAEELQLLVAECTDAYNTENELNEYDKIYKDTPWTEFEDAYITADDVKESDDILVTTDAYDDLYDTYETLKKSKLETVTKTEISKARAAYEKALDLEFKFQPWQRGSVSGSGTKFDGQSFAWGILYEYVASGNTALVAAYKAFDELKGVTVTSNPNTVAAVKAMNEAAKVLTGFSAKLESGGKTQIKALLKTYSNQLAYSYNATAIAAIVNSLVSAAGNDADNIQFLRKTGKYLDGGDASVAIDAASKDTYWNVNVNTKGIVLSAELDIKLTSSAPSDVYYILDKNVKLDNGNNAIVAGDDGKFFYGTKQAAIDAAAAAGITADVKVLTKGKSIKLSNYVGATTQNVIDGSSITPTEPSTTTIDGTLDSINSEAGTIKSALGTLSAAVATLTGDANNATDMTSANQTLVIAAIGTASAAVAALETAISDAKGATVMSPEDLENVKNKYTAAKNAIDAVTGHAAFTDSTAVDPTQTIDTDDIVDLMKANGDFETNSGAYNTTYSEAVLAEAWSVSKAGNNSTYDKAGENFSNKFSYKVNGTDLTFGDSGNSYKFGAYTSSKNPEGSDITTASLPAAMQLCSDFFGKNSTGILTLDNINAIVPTVGFDMSSNEPKSAAWNMLYNYLKYALEDEFKGSSDKTYTLADVKTLVGKAYDLADQTVETAMFNGSHVAMIKDRTGAAEWVKLAEDDKKAKNYIENFTDYNVATRKAADDFDSTTMWKQLNDTYSQLEKEVKAFKYSYGEIISYMADVAKKIDSGDIKGSAATKLQADLNDAALKMMTLGEDAAALTFTGPESPDDNDALFNDDGTMNKNNRLFTNEAAFDLVTSVNASTGAFTTATVDKNDFHTDMKKAYEKLVKDYEDATKPEDKPKMTEDLNGSGKLDLGDVQELLKIVVDGKGEVAKHDFNDDKAVNMADVQFLLTKWVNA